MVKHNNISNVHFKKHWQTFVKTWFDQPAQKKKRRQRRFNKKKNCLFYNSAKNFIRPLIHCPSHMYNMKVRFGKGFSLYEISNAKISKKYSRSLGISVDKKRKSRNIMEKYNTERLSDYMNKIVFLKKTKHKINSKNDHVCIISKKNSYLKKPFKNFYFNK